MRQIAPNAFVSYCVQNRTSLKGEGNNEKGEAVLLSTTEPRDTFFLSRRSACNGRNIYMCRLPKLTAFKATSDPARPESNQHEVEWNVECPSCSRTNAIVWPQNSFGPLVVPISKRVATKSGSGDFYPQDTSCTSCGVPNLLLPTLSPFSRCSALVGLLLPRRSQMLPDRPSRKVFEFLNDNLITFLERILVTGDRVKHELEALLSRSWYS